MRRAALSFAVIAAVQIILPAGVLDLAFSGRMLDLSGL
jgi:hypothetical protein